MKKNSEVRIQKSEVRSQKSEVRSQNSEFRIQKSEFRIQESEFRSQNSDPRLIEDHKTRKFGGGLKRRLFIHQSSEYLSCILTTGTFILFDKIGNSGFGLAIAEAIVSTVCDLH
ncbi:MULTISPECIES: hypothetical protein [unclassified Nostoc]|uniref:hypothetical protein n=1 Tax=unclassified Nostoc TaxID=2593658 RepID=UPI00262F203F|nr:hypothetical protein [Nostoc sp. S13]MDF5738693.1 hypothetical protein [Nostoc sp. S13]